MSVYREKDQTSRKIRESSTSRKPKREESSDRRPIITQEKQIKQKPPSTTSKDKSKTQPEKLSSDKTHRRRKDGESDHKKSSETERKSSKTEETPVKVKRHESVEVRSKKEMKPDAMRDVLERKIMKKMEAVEKSGKHVREEKTRKSSRESEILKKKEDERKLKSRRDRTRTRTLSPTEVKQLVPPRIAFQLDSGDSIRREESREERPKTEKSEKMENGEEEGGGGDEAYEDDFEDYESDFEEDDDNDEEPEQKEELPPPVPEVPPISHTPEPPQQKLPEVDERWKLTVKKNEIENIKRSIKRENYEVSERRKSITKIEEDDSDKENIGNRKRQILGRQMLDFSRASMRQKKQKEVAATRKRGEELLSMISLDAISYSIFEIPPIPYEEYMKAFGKSNTKQVHVQTNEDDLDEETQTDEISTSNKWTQNPPEYLGSRKTESEVSYILTKEERLGVGGDFPVEEDEMVIQPRTNGLWSFLSWASQIILMTLERRSGNFLSLENLPNHSKAMAFGDGFVRLNINDIPFLKGRSIANLCLLSKNSGKLLSVHVNKDKSFQKSMICVWSFRELSKPLKILLASNRVTSSCFGLSQGNLVFAGLSDGTICVWDLREPLVFHNRTANEWTLQSPTYTTAGHFGEDGHSSAVVAIRKLGKVEGGFGFGDFTPMQICSLDRNGKIIIWSVIQIEKAQRNAPSEDLGLAYWGRVKLVKSSSFFVFSSLREEIPGLHITCKDFIINEVEEDGFYVANSLGSIHHCSSYGSLMKPKFYTPGKQNAIIETTCLELCPFNGNYFLAGCGDGTVRLHSRHQETPLICLNPNVAGDEKEAAVVSLTWMQMRPCVFFALDSMSRIHIWDLGVSDMYPETSLMLTEKKITCMKLLPTSDPRQIPFIVLGTEGGSVEIHRLKKEYGGRSANDVGNEMKMFLKYVSIL